MTFAEIAREMNISACRVKQIYDRAMKKVRCIVQEDPSLRSVLEEYDVEYEANWNTKDQRTPRPQEEEVRDTRRSVGRRPKAHQGSN